MGWNEVVGGFLSLINFAKNLILIIEKIIIMIPKLLNYMIYIILTPGKVISDSIYGFTTGLKLIFMTTLDTIQGKSINLIKPHIEDDDPVNSKREKEDCLGPSVLEILILLLCPPLAIFIRKGLKGFFTIVITAVFTYFYYLPGLIYASLHVL
jgi:uncharacterized membrane protein YqaE (UPF0057 family)